VVDVTAAVLVVLVLLPLHLLLKAAPVAAQLQLVQILQEHLGTQQQ
jgi:hypothetical protein